MLRKPDEPRMMAENPPAYRRPQYGILIRVKRSRPLPSKYVQWILLGSNEPGMKV